MGESSQIDAEIDALYELRPGEFVAARDALAKRLRGAGERADADAVRSLPRPTVAAWAVNQLPRLEPEWTQALATAGERLADAHAALLADGDRDGWQQATANQRHAIERLTRLAAKLLREERGSVSQALRDKVRETLHAATIDPEARAAVLEGRLSRELHAPGTIPLAVGPVDRAGPGRPAAKRARSGRGAGTAASDRASSPAAEPGAKRAGRKGARRPPATAERDARAQRRAAEREARAALRRAERERVTAEVAVEKADQAAQRARKAHEAAAAALADAEQAERERRSELDAAEAAFAEARTQLDAREAAVTQARAELDRAAE